MLALIKCSVTAKKDLVCTLAPLLWILEIFQLLYSESALAFRHSHGNWNFCTQELLFPEQKFHMWNFHPVELLFPRVLVAWKFHLQEPKVICSFV